MGSHGGQLENDGVDDEEGYDNEPPPALFPHHPRIDTPFLRVQLGWIILII